jgi:hypothetical protein
MKALRIALNSITMIEIDSDLPALKKEIGDNISTIGLKDGGVMIVDEDGMKKQCPHNDCASYVSGQHVYGPALIVGERGDELDDVPDQYLVLLNLGE